METKITWFTTFSLNVESKLSYLVQKAHQKKIPPFTAQDFLFLTTNSFIFLLSFKLKFSIPVWHITDFWRTGFCVMGWWNDQPRHLRHHSVFQLLNMSSVHLRLLNIFNTTLVLCLGRSKSKADVPKCPVSWSEGWQGSFK